MTNFTHYNSNNHSNILKIDYEKTAINWIKLSRTIQDHWVWENPKYLKWWLDLLLLAEYKTGKQKINSKLVTIKRGDLVASLSFLQDRWTYKDEQGAKHKPHKYTITKFLSLLEQDGMILKSNNLPHNITLISIVNYSEYQGIMPITTEGSRTDDGTDAYTNKRTDSCTDNRTNSCADNSTNNGTNPWTYDGTSYSTTPGTEGCTHYKNLRSEEYI